MAQPTTEAPAAGERRLRMTYEEFLRWVDEDVHAEWVDGEVTVFVPPAERHQDVLWFLATLLGWYARRLGLGKVMLAPFEMRLARSSREPDLLFVAAQHLDRLTGKRLDGPADLVIELVSDDSVARDRAEKFAEYQEAGIPEYWVFDPRPGKEREDFYRLVEGAYEAVHPDADGRIHSAALPGFWIVAGWLRQDPLPDPLDMLAIIAPDVMRAAADAWSTAQDKGRG
jgi:Uma2 family endonuclease